MDAIVVVTYLLAPKKSGFCLLPGCELQGLFWAIHEMNTLSVFPDIWLSELEATVLWLPENY